MPTCVARRVRFTVVFGLLLVAPVEARQGPQETPSPAGCQVETIADLTRCVRVGERVRVRTTEWLSVEGEFLGYAEDRLVIRARGDRLASFADGDLVEVAVVRPERSKERIAQSTGTALGVALILMGSGFSQDAGQAIAIGVSLGAVGAAVGFLLPQDTPRTLLQRQPPDPVGVRAVSASGAPIFATTVQRLPRLLQQDDRIRLRRANTSSLEGRYAGLDGEAVLLRTGERLHRIGAADLLSVERLTPAHPSAKKWAVIGGASLLILAWIGSTIEDPDQEPLTAGEKTTAVIGGGVIGAGAGAGLSRVVTRTDAELVFYRPSATLGTAAPASRGLRWTFRF